MSQKLFATKLKDLDLKPHSAHEVLGIARSTVFRLIAGTSEEPLVVKRLLDMYERHGIPDAHKKKPRR